MIWWLTWGKRWDEARHQALGSIPVRGIVISVGCDEVLDIKYIICRIPDDHKVACETDAGSP
ncbi:MAG TPA: hypothetical protein PKE15_14325, partial [Ottowia sp.]|nr:hypothetical protein [Ottowia sp.]